MAFQSVIMNHAPLYWESHADEQTDLASFSSEYEQIAKEARLAMQSSNKTISKIVRIQNVFDLGQLLIREQLLVVANPNTDYYRVRRFIKLSSSYYTQALKYNLDHRRCGLTSLQFHANINSSEFRYGDLLVAVQVVTSTPDEPDIIPSNNLEYFIDYIIFFN